MIIEKIEKLSQTTFIESKCTLNAGKIPEIKGSMQACYFNLQNLKKMVEDGNERLVESGKKQKSPRPQIRRNSEALDSLPQISIINVKNQSMISRLDGQAFGQNYSNQSIISHRQHRNSYSNQKLLLNSRVEQLLKTSTSFLKNDQSLQQQLKARQKQNKPKSQIDFRTRKVHKNLLGLTKQQRFFQQTDVTIPEQVVQRMGLYEASNIFKPSNVDKLLKSGYEEKLKPVINLRYATFSLSGRNQFFLTDTSYLPEIHEAEPKRQASRPAPQKPKSIEQPSIIEAKPEKKVLSDTVRQQPSYDSESRPMEIPEHLEVVIRNYQVVRDEDYYIFRKNNIEEWSEISFILSQILQFLRKIKISNFSYKFQKQTFMKQLWSCRKMQEKTLQKLLKIRLRIKQKSENTEQVKSLRIYTNRQEVIRQLVHIWRDRKNLEKRKREKQREKQLMMWMCLRILARYKIKVKKQKVIARVEQLNEKLRNGDWDYEVEIHIPSFSESEYARTTTQYMQYYENMFYHMWKSSNKQFVLVIPAINEATLKMYQERIKLGNKNITLICPEAHQLFPSSLPLSACLFYSKEGLARVKSILEGKRGVIIPGRLSRSSHLYEEYLSEYLNCPLLSTFNPPLRNCQFKQLWQKHNVPTVNYGIIEPASTLDMVIAKLSAMIIQSQKVKVWVFKLNEEFNGRGIATFDVMSCKKIREQLSREQNSEQIDIRTSCKMMQRRKQQSTDLVHEYLSKNFRLKLKVNFENCLYRVDQFIDIFTSKGGIIEQFMQDCETYELGFKLEPGYTTYTHGYILDELEEEKHIACTVNYTVDFVTKASVFAFDGLPTVVKEFSRKADKILKAEKYLGYVSITLLYSPRKNQIYAIEIKPYMTANVSMSYFLKIFEKKGREATNRRHANINPNQFQSHSQLISHREAAASKPMFLFIPVIMFTDVDEAIKAEIIQNLVLQSWGKTGNNLFTHPVACDSSDSFNGTLYMSMGLSLSLVIVGKPHEVKRIRQQAVDEVRELSQKIEAVRTYKGKQQTRDVFQFGDLIRALTRIK